ncbi:hypothetical protein AB0B45_00270 [Nonomuraea sp. NPDC049152]
MAEESTGTVIVAGLANLAIAAAKEAGRRVGGAGFSITGPRRC